MGVCDPSFVDAPTGADDAAALIESLPPTLRAQVLADADDTVLQVLPQNVAAEARRLRASFEAQVLLINLKYGEKNCTFF